MKRVIIILIVLLFLVGCTEDKHYVKSVDDLEREAFETGTEDSNTEQEAEPREAIIGETVKHKKGLDMTLNGYRYVNYIDEMNDYKLKAVAKAYYDFVIIDITLYNPHDEPIEFVTRDYYVYFCGNYAEDTILTNEIVLQKGISGQVLEPGDEIRGEMAFPAPDFEHITLRYELKTYSHEYVYFDLGQSDVVHTDKRVEKYINCAYIVEGKEIED